MKMSYQDWKDKTAAFKKIDVRGVQGNFFHGLKQQAMQLPAGSGLEIVQSFDPIPLYEVMEGLGFEHFTEQKGEAEFHAYFYRTEVKQEEKDIPMRPATRELVKAYIYGLEQHPCIRGWRQGLPADSI